MIEDQLTVDLSQATPEELKAWALLRDPVAISLWLEREEERHLPGKHKQAKHGGPPKLSKTSYLDKLNHPTKKAPAKKAPAKKVAPAKKATPAKKVAPAKAPAKSVPAKKVAAPKKVEPAVPPPPKASTKATVTDSISSIVAKDRPRGYTSLRGAPETAKAIQATYEFTSTRGMTSRVNLTTSTIKDGEIVVKGGIYNADGDKVGDFQRTLYYRQGKAYNDRIKISPKYTGQRFGDEFYAHTEKNLVAMGIKKIELDANYDVGGYAWARRGVGWGALSRKEGETNVATNIDRYLVADAKRPENERLTAGDRAQLERWSKRLRKPLTGSAPSPKDIASLGEGSYSFSRKTKNGREFTSWPGKEIMLGATWAGEYRPGSLEESGPGKKYMGEVRKNYDKEEKAFVPNDEVKPHAGETTDYNAFHVDNHLSPQASESRAELSTVVRIVDRGVDYCLECLVNEDPDKIPLHPNCSCDVRTEEVSTGEQEDVVEELQEELEPVETVTEIGAEAMVVIPTTVSVLPIETFRYGDVMQWLSQVESHLSEDAEVIITANYPDNQVWLAVTRKVSVGASKTNVQNPRR